MNDRAQADLTFRHFFFLWFGAAVSMAEILTGGLLTSFGFRNGLPVILIGHAIGVSILVLGGIIGSREKIAALQSTRLSFGVYGSYLFSLLNVLQLIGWTAVMIIAASRSLNLISMQLWKFNNLPVWCIVLGLLVLGWIVSGRAGFKQINVAAVAMLFILTIVLSTVVFKSGKLWTSMGANAKPDWGLGMELNILMPLSWLPLIADYTRFAKTTRGGAWGSWWGYFIGSSWMYLIGLGSGIVSHNPDPTGMMMATHLGIAALGIVVLATVTTTFLDVYSAGVTFLNVFPRLREKTVAAVIGVIGTLIAVIVPIEQYQNFLYAIGSVFAPLFAILISDYFVMKTGRRGAGELLLDWGAALIWLFGMLLYVMFVKINFVLGATLPVMLLTGMINLLLRKRVIASWKTYRPAPRC